MTSGVRLLPVLAALLAALLTAATPASAADRIVVLDDPDRSVAAETAQREASLDFAAEQRFDSAIDAFTADLTAEQIERLEADPEVAAVVPDRRVSIAGAVAAANASAIPAGVHRVVQTPRGTVREAADGAVAVIDTGIDLDHPDLDATAGINCITRGAAPDDGHGHGTHVAGTIGARNDARGVTGVAPGTEVIAVKVLGDDGEGSTSDVLCGVEWVLEHAAARNITVANFSLGGFGPDSTCRSDPQHAVFCALAAARITPVVAAGNDGRDFGAAGEPDVPAAYPQVLTVSATADTDGIPGAAGPRACNGTADDRAASFSNYATADADEAHLVAAPGSCIRSTARGGGTQSMSGTSMAAPHVAALVALCKGEAGAAGPCAGLSTPQVIARMRMTNEWTSFTGLTGRRFGPLAVLSDPAVPTPAVTPVVETEPASRTTTPAQQPVTVPTPPPAPPASPTPPPSTPATGPAPTTPPAGQRQLPTQLRLLTRRLGRLRSTRGLAVRATPGATVRLTVSRALARRLGLRSTTLATARATRRGTATLRLTSPTKRKLRRTKRLAIRLTATAPGLARSATALTLA